MDEHDTSPGLVKRNLFSFMFYTGLEDRMRPMVLLPRLFCRILAGFLHLSKDLTGDDQGIAPGRDATIDHGMPASFADLLLGQAVVDSRADVDSQLRRSVESYQHGEVHQRPLAIFQPWPRVAVETCLPDILHTCLGEDVVFLRKTVSHGRTSQSCRSAFSLTIRDNIVA